MKLRVWKNRLLFFFVAILLCGCTYYNTFYNAKKIFKEGENAQKKAPPDRRSTVGKTQYEAAIKKASKVLTFHPKSKWADDALFLIGRAYFNMEDYVKARRKFEELLASFAKSKLVDDSRYFISMCHYHSGEEVQAATQLKAFLESEKMGKKRKAEASFLTGEIYFHQETDYSPRDNDIIINLFDTCGQQIFYPLRQATAIGVQGILFFIDSALLQLHLDFSNIQKLITAFEELKTFLGAELQKIPGVFICNKQDLIKTDRGKAGFIKKSIAF